MRFKLLLAVVAAAGLLAAGAAYVALLGINIDPSTSTLTGRWITVDHATTIHLDRDGTFTATGIENCLGTVRAVLTDGYRPKIMIGRDAVLDVTSGAGTWTAKGRFLDMAFRSPHHFTIRWQASQVTWQFRPTAVALTSSNGSKSDDSEGFPITCAFTS